MEFAQLHCLTNYSFLRGASHPCELVERAHQLGYRALAITDECSLAGIVKAHVAARELGIKLIVGSEFSVSSGDWSCGEGDNGGRSTGEKSNGCKLVALAPDRCAYAELAGFITLARRRAEKGSYEAHLRDLRFRLQHCLVIWPADDRLVVDRELAKTLARSFPGRFWIGIGHLLAGGEQLRFDQWRQLARQLGVPMVACGGIIMHDKSRKPLQDTLCAIRENTPVQRLGTRLQANAEAYLKPLDSLARLYSPDLLAETARIADLCRFSLEELRYQYPEELVPDDRTPIEHLQCLVDAGASKRWPDGVPTGVALLLHKELALIEEMRYEYYFLTVHDIVRFARERDILCQGRGSAANSVVCYCLFITEIAPGQINLLFERFISKERNEPPDIDVDFEHQRREEVIQYIYGKYGRERAALAATVITYRARSAIRDVGKALGLDPGLVEQLAGSLAWWDRSRDLARRIEEAGLQADRERLLLFYRLVHEILGFPRHLSQHVGGFVITRDKLSDLVPLENASMAERTIIQWDKEDLEAMGLMKVDVLALGMLTALRKTLSYVRRYHPGIASLADIPREDKATYAMLSRGDSVGVFQVESRAQMSMLPRLRPQTFYDLVIEIAIVRPGPIQGDMVHPYLRRRNGIEPVTYESEALKSVLEPTLGVPIFQEQAIRLAMVAAGFGGGEADQLRRAMASWGKNGNLIRFQEKFISGMLANGYSEDFARRLFEQIKGFGGYGFPESHSASFALLCYASSWLKCHHPAAFYCGLLNSQPMGFYSPSQLIQDARRHGITVQPVDINRSKYESSLEAVSGNGIGGMGKGGTAWGIRLGFHQVKSLDGDKAKTIESCRGERIYSSIEELAARTGFGKVDIQILASADALAPLSGHRHQSRWDAAALEPARRLLQGQPPERQSLLTPPPGEVRDVSTDYETLGLSLRRHPMALLRGEEPFNRCKRQTDLADIGSGRFVRVAGLVTGRQRPGTAKGTVFLTLEDETGNINVIVWKNTQEVFRQQLLKARLLVVVGRLETADSVIHVIAGQLHDYSHRLGELALKSRDFH